LQFSNLKANGNSISQQEQENVWIPKIVFINCLNDVITKNDDFSSLFIERKGTAKPNSMKQLMENQIYTGNTNPFIYQRVFELNFGCGFDLTRYPFDYQECLIEVIFY
jgi:hypothetical protein